MAAPDGSAISMPMEMQGVHSMQMKQSPGLVPTDFKQLSCGHGVSTVLDNVLAVTEYLRASSIAADMGKVGVYAYRGGCCFTDVICVSPGCPAHVTELRTLMIVDVLNHVFRVHDPSATRRTAPHRIIVCMRVSRVCSSAAWITSKPI